jgi:hypothetical protein
MSETRGPVLTGGCRCGAVRCAPFARLERAGICHCLRRPGITHPCKT